MKTWYANIEVEGVEWHAKALPLTPVQCLSDEQEYRLYSRPPHQTSVLDLTTAFVAVLKQTIKNSLITYTHFIVIYYYYYLIRQSCVCCSKASVNAHIEHQNWEKV